jgi:hypothetical protein
LTRRDISPRPSRRRVGHSFYTRHNHWIGWRPRSLVALVTLGSLSNLCGAAEEFNFYDFWTHQPIAEFPPGPYSGWSEEQRAQAVKLIKLNCTRAGIGATMSIAQQKGSDDQKKEELQTLALACFAAHLPADHPAREKYEREALQHYEAAKALGADLPAPTFDAAVKSP